MPIDFTLLGRLQFGFTITFHIIFPAFTIGLSAFIATLHGRCLWKGDEKLRLLADFWTKIFAVSFAMGVVSGIVLSYEFGLNWSRFSTVTGNIVGPLVAYEVLTAFFLEATFLGIMLFGAAKVPPWLHFLSSVMVAIGTLTSAFWILSANSWMQSPAGYEMRDGIAYPVDWFAAIFNPTFPLRFVHMVIAAYLTTAVVVMAVGARYALAGRFADESRVMLRMGLGLALVLAPVQIFVGDMHGLVTAREQPAKLAAIEAHWDSAEVAPLELFAWPDSAAETDDYAIDLPHVGSLIITHHWDGKFKGLKDFAPQDRPPLAPVFFAFRAMAGIGFLLLGLVLWGAVSWARGSLFSNRVFLQAAAWSWPLGFIAIIMGWMVTEIGRQPWAATGILRTVDATSPVAPQAIMISLALFVIVYGIVFTVGIFYVNRLIGIGPLPAFADAEPGVPSRSLSGAEQAARGATHPDAQEGQP